MPNLTPLDVLCRAYFFLGQVVQDEERDIPTSVIVMFDEATRETEFIWFDDDPEEVIAEVFCAMEHRHLRPVAVEFCESEEEDYRNISVRFFADEPSPEDEAIISAGYDSNIGVSP